MKLLVIGASSYIGAKLYEDLKGIHRVTGTYYQHPLFPEMVKLDIREPAAVSRVIDETRPEVIIHLANYSSSRYIPKPGESLKSLNMDATECVATSAAKVNAKLVFFSSQAANTKLNDYGVYKASSEDIIKKTTREYFILRPSAVIGLSPNRNNGKIIDEIIRAIKGERVEFENSWILQPTYINHISQVIEQVINKDYWNSDLNLFTDHAVTQYQIACDILSAFGKTALPLQTGRFVPLLPDNSRELAKYTLVPDSYEKVIAEIIAGIKTII